MSLQNQTALTELAEEARLIRQAISNVPAGSRQNRLRQMRGRIRDEIFDLVEADLQYSTASYVPINDTFRASRADLIWIHNQARTFELNASRAVRLAQLAARYAVLL